MSSRNTRAPSAFTIWLNASIFVGFIAFMVLTVEGTLAWIAGSFLHSMVLGFVVLAVIGLPTLYWLWICMRHALSAERDLLAPPSV